MYREDSHYYIIRQESKLVYYFTIFILIYLGCYTMAITYAFLACNLLFDDEEDDDIEVEEPALEMYKAYFDDSENRDLLELEVDYQTLTDYMQLLVDIPLNVEGGVNCNIWNNRFVTYFEKIKIFDYLYSLDFSKFSNFSDYKQVKNLEHYDDDEKKFELVESEFFFATNEEESEEEKELKKKEEEDRIESLNDPVLQAARRYAYEIQMKQKSFRKIKNKERELMLKEQAEDDEINKQILLENKCNILTNSFLNNKSYDKKLTFLSSDLPPTSIDMKAVHHYKGTVQLTTKKDFIDRQHFVVQSFISHDNKVSKFLLKQLMKYTTKAELAYNDYLVKSFINSGVYLTDNLEFAIFAQKFEKTFYQNKSPFFMKCFDYIYSRQNNSDRF